MIYLALAMLIAIGGIAYSLYIIGRDKEQKAH